MSLPARLLRVISAPIAGQAAVGLVLALAVGGGLWGFGHARFKAGFAAGRAAEIEEYRAAYRTALVDILRRDRQAAQISGRIRDGHNQQLGRLSGDFGELRKRIPTHVTPESDRNCVVPVGFVQLLDAGIAKANGRASPVPRSAGRSVDADSGYALSDISTAFLGDAELGGILQVAGEWRLEAVGWRTWYVAHRDAWDAP